MAGGHAEEGCLTGGGVEGRGTYRHAAATGVDVHGLRLALRVPSVGGEGGAAGTACGQASHIRVMRRAIVRHSLLHSAIDRVCKGQVQGWAYAKVPTLAARAESAPPRSRASWGCRCTCGQTQAHGPHSLCIRRHFSEGCAEFCLRLCTWIGMDATYAVSRYRMCVSS
jgi:hypothetical protein